jgi:hypothetical protein
MFVKRPVSMLALVAPVRAGNLRGTGAVLPFAFAPGRRHERSSQTSNTSARSNPGDPIKVATSTWSLALPPVGSQDSSPVASE